MNYFEYINKSEIYTCVICNLRGSEKEINLHLEEIKNLKKFPFVEQHKLPIGSLIKVKNNRRNTCSLTTIVGYFYTTEHELCYNIYPKIITKDYNEYTYGEFGEYIHNDEIISYKDIKNKNYSLEQNSLED